MRERSRLWEDRLPEMQRRRVLGLLTPTADPGNALQSPGEVRGRGKRRSRFQCGAVGYSLVIRLWEWFSEWGPWTSRSASSVRVPP